MSEKRPRSTLGRLRHDLQKRGQAQMQQFMGKMMSNPELMKSAGQAMTLLSQVNQIRAKGVKPLNEVLTDLERAIDRLDKKVDAISGRLDDLSASADTFESRVVEKIRAEATASAKPAGKALD